MNRERWQRVKQLLEEAIALEASQRSSFLDRVCDADSELRREVDSLLSAHAQAGTAFLKNPAVDLKSAVRGVPARAPGIGVCQIIEEIGQNSRMRRASNTRRARASGNRFQAHRA